MQWRCTEQAVLPGSVDQGKRCVARTSYAVTLVSSKPGGEIVRHTSLATALLVLACTGSGEPSQSPSPSYHVLFIGNSLTAVNDLPHTVAALAATVEEVIAV